MKKAQKRPKSPNVEFLALCERVRTALADLAKSPVSEGLDPVAGMAF